MTDLFAELGTPRHVTIDGLRIRYIRGDRTDGVPVLLTSPWPESLYAFYRVWPKLSAVAPLVALDLPGFGHSEGRSDLMSPREMGDFILKIVAQFEFSRLHLIAPDVGTSAALFAAAHQPEPFVSLVVGSGVADPKLATGSLKDLMEAPSMEPFRAMSGEDIVLEGLARMLKPNPPKEILEDYRQASAGSRFVDAAAYVRNYAQDLPRLSDLLPSIQTPVLVISGLLDPLVPHANGDFLQSRLPHCQAVTLHCGHFAWEDAADDYGRLATGWVSGGFLSV
jgi:pimeloyl-ACP methyl ester carboxylesterase